MFHFSYSKQSRAFNKLNWADWHSQETYMNLLNWYSHWLHTKTCIHLVVNHTYHNYSDQWFEMIWHQHQLWVFSSSDAFSYVPLKFVWMMSCSRVVFWSPLQYSFCQMNVRSTDQKICDSDQLDSVNIHCFLLGYLHKLKNTKEANNSTFHSLTE